MAKNKTQISDELLTAYIEGTATPEEMMTVVEALKVDESLRETLFILESLDTDASTGRYLPMERLAAASPDSLCDIRCELHILQDYDFDADLASAVRNAGENKWLKETGTPLFNVGRLLESRGMAVCRRYDCSLKDLADILSQGNRAIAVIDYGVLTGKPVGTIFHAVICLSVSDDSVRIYDPAKGAECDYSANLFEEAWTAARNYIVVASSADLEYEPHPIDLSDVLLDDNLLELTEAIAENAHEVWARERKGEGWRFGPERDDRLRTTPDMVPYSDLPESEKEYDRKIAFDTLRLARKLGFRLERPSVRKCPHCGRTIQDFAHFCPMCGEKLSWKDFCDE